MKFLTGWKIDLGPKPERMIIRYEEDSLRVDAVRKRKISASENLGIREIPDEVLIRRLRACAARRPGSVVLVLPRKMLIERRFDLPGGDAEMNQGSLMERIRHSLPVGLDELAFGVAFKEQKRGACGTLLAVPLKNIDALLSLLDTAGLSPDEIISSDQALMGLIGGEKDSVLLMNEGLETVDLILAEQGFIQAVKTLERSGGEIQREIEFFLLESGARPGKFLSVRDSDYGMEAVLFGACCLDLSRVISLLPQKRKLEKREKLRRKDVRESAAWLLFALALLAGGVMAHRFKQETFAREWRLEYERLKPALREIQTGLDVAAELWRRQEANREVLESLRALSLAIPSGVVLEELVWKNGEIRLRGTSASYAGVSAAVKAAEEAGRFTAHLDYARVRKRESREFFEFSLTVERGLEKNNAGLPDLCSMGLAMARQAILDKKKLLAEYLDFQGQRTLVTGDAAVLNEWAGSLMSLCGRHALKIGKLEPLGKSSPGKYTACVIRLSCRGGLKDIAAFLYGAASSRDGVAVEEMRLLASREMKNSLTCEMLLSKF